jgi:chromosome segregation ATPase
MIQPKYQQALNDRGEFEHKITEILDRENRLRKNYESRVAELSKVREDKAAIEAVLSAAREALSTSAIPEIADFNKLKDELQAQRIENERLQKRISNMQSEIEYMRGNYQTASSLGADLANEVTELKEENAILSRKASDNARRIHEIQASSEIRQYLARIDELENQLAESNREVEKKNEELKSLLNGRRATRGTSVPRSPRMGTMSPNVSSRRVLGAGVGSRGNSPAPGDAQPYKGTFGDALMFGEKAGGSGRWGNHLREQL